MTFKRVLVIKLKQPGDVLVSTPVIGAIHEAWPGAQVSLLVPRGTEDMVADHPGVHRLFVLDRRGASWGELWRLLRDLRRERFDLALELSGGDRGAFFAWASGARQRVGFARPRQPWWQRHGLFTLLLPRPPVRMHLVEQNLAALKALGAVPTTPRLAFHWNAGVAARVRELLAGLGLTGKKFAVVHPGAGWRFKCWTPEGYARVIEALEEEWGLPVVVTGSGAALEQELLQEILAHCRLRPRSLVGRLTLKELGALIAQARLFFGADSAPMHLAAAVGTPAVALFGPSGDFNWGPWGEGHLVIKKGWDCQPCGRDGCDGSKISRCLTELTPEEVLEEMRGGGGGERKEKFGGGGGGGAHRPLAPSPKHSLREMKITLLRQRVSGAGGAETTLGYLVRGLVAAGHAVTLLGSQPAEAGRQALGSLAGYGVVPVWGGKTGRLLSYALNSRRAVLSLKPEVVFSLERTLFQHVYRAGDGCHREWLARRKPSLSPAVRAGQALSLFHRVMLWLEGRLFAAPDLKGVIANSRMVREEVARHYGVPREKLTVI